MRFRSLPMAGILFLLASPIASPVAADPTIPPSPGEPAVTTVAVPQSDVGSTTVTTVAASQPIVVALTTTTVDDSQSSDNQPAERPVQELQPDGGGLVAVLFVVLVVLPLAVIGLRMLHRRESFRAQARSPVRKSRGSGHRRQAMVPNVVPPPEVGEGRLPLGRSQPTSQKTPELKPSPVSIPRKERGVRPIVPVGPETVNTQPEGVAANVGTGERGDPELGTTAGPMSPTSDPSLATDRILPESSPGLSPTPVPNDQARVVPPQIGERSAFAARSWWDSRDDWCQLAPSGMSSDVTCDVGTAGSLAVAAASLRGHKHKVTGKPCQDAFSVRVSAEHEDRKFLIAVSCDGLSSARFSHYGARRTAELLSAELRELVEAQGEPQAADLRAEISEILRRCADRLIPNALDEMGAIGILDDSVTPNDFNTTLTFAVIPSSAGYDEATPIIVGGIGDSPIFVLRRDQVEWESIPLSSVDEQMLSSATDAFPATSKAIVRQINFSSGDVLAIMSDGVGNFIRVRGQQTILGTYLAEQWRRPKGLTDFINDVAFDLKSADDDRTVIAVWAGRE